MSSNKEQAQSDVVSVVVTYNGMPWIDRCLGSLQSSSLPTRIVVVDNGSTDGTQQRIKEAYPAVHFIQAEKNLGFGQANNIGLRMALDTGADHAFLLNQDAWVLPETLDRLVEAANGDAKYGILSPMHLDGPGQQLDLFFSKCLAPDKCPDLYSDLILGRRNKDVYPAAFVNAAAWLVTRKCLLTVGGFSPFFFHYGEDDNYVDRLHYHKLLLGVVPTAWIHHDRAPLGENPFFADPVDLLVRLAAVRHSDPGSKKSPKSQIRALRLTMLRCLISGQRAAFHDARKRASILSALDSDVLVKFRDASRPSGSSFL